MKSRQEQKIKDGVAPSLEPGEDVLAAIVAPPRGHTQAVAGVRGLGTTQQGRAVGAAEEAGVRLADPMALVLTNRRLLTVAIGTPIGLGLGGKVKEVMSAVPLDEVDAIEARRFAAAQKITVTVRGSSFQLEANATAGAKALAEAFAAAKVAVVEAALQAG